jgi:hypothetical protein
VGDSSSVMKKMTFFSVAWDKETQLAIEERIRLIGLNMNGRLERIDKRVKDHKSVV